MLTVDSTVPASRVPELTDLMRTAWWMSDRTTGDVERLLANSDLVVAVLDRDNLVGFTRVLTDFTYVALLLDVIVAQSHRGSGIGAVLLDAVVGHPALAGVRSLELACQPELIPFYRRWGFTDEVANSRHMRRTADARLSGRPGS
ncbi:MAG TPA: GNAT family N-acetyltransferase [Kribbella sp.]